MYVIVIVGVGCGVVLASLFVILYFFIYSLCSLSFLDLLILITPLASSSYAQSKKYVLLTFFQSLEQIK
jgi:hypothetical protein